MAGHNIGGGTAIGSDGSRKATGDDTYPSSSLEIVNSIRRLQLSSDNKRIVSIVWSHISIW